MNELSITPSPSNDSLRMSDEVPPPPPRRWSSDSFDKTSESSISSHENGKKATFVPSPSSEGGELRLSMLRSRSSSSEGVTSGDKSPETFEGHTITQVSSSSKTNFAQEKERFLPEESDSFPFGLEDLKNIEREIENESIEKSATAQKEALRECKYLVNLYTNFTDIEEQDSKELTKAIDKLEEANDALANVSDQHDDVIQEAQGVLTQAKNIVQELKIEESLNEEDYHDEMTSAQASREIKTLFSPSDEALQEIKQQVTASFQNQDEVNKKTFSLPKEMLRRQKCFCQPPTQESTAYALKLAELSLSRLTPEMLQSPNGPSKQVKYAQQYVQLAQKEYKEAQKYQRSGDFKKATEYAQGAVENALNVVVARNQATHGNSSKLLLTLKKEQYDLGHSLQPLEPVSTSNIDSSHIIL